MTDWVTVGEGLGLARCDRCGVGLTVPTPRAAARVVSTLERFLEWHASCGEPEEEPQEAETRAVGFAVRAEPVEQAERRALRLERC
jgi:hypothetical protein